MKQLKLMIAPAALSLMLAATPALAQTQTTPQKPPVQPPVLGQPPSTTAPAPAPTAAPKPPAPFPQGAKMAFINIQAIAANSSAGKDASKRLADLNSKKAAEIADKNKQLQALTSKRDTGGAVLNDAARATLDKDIDKLQRDIQFAQSNAQAELQDLQNELQGEFQKRLIPVIEQVAKEKGLHAVFSIADSGAAYVHPGLNISDEVVKRLDAAAAKK
jgi:outer membrane protein